MNLPTITFKKQFEFSRKKIAIIDTDSISILPMVKKEYLDYLILSKQVPTNIKDLFKNLTINQIILDSSIPEWKAQLLKAQCDSLHIACYDVRKQGAFVRNL